VIAFTNDLRINIEAIDEQHKTLIDYINNLMAMGSRAVNKSDIEKSLQFIGNYAIKHFSDEEALQKKNKYPQYEQHRMHHIEFVESYQKLVENYKKMGASTDIMLQLNRTVIAWVSNHIQVEDVNFAKYIRNHHAFF